MDGEAILLIGGFVIAGLLLALAVLKQLEPDTSGDTFVGPWTWSDDA